MALAIGVPSEAAEIATDLKCEQVHLSVLLVTSEEFLESRVRPLFEELRLKCKTHGDTGKIDAGMGKGNPQNYAIWIDLKVDYSSDDIFRLLMGGPNVAEISARFFHVRRGWVVPQELALPMVVGSKSNDPSGVIEVFETLVREWREKLKRKLLKSRKLPR